MADTPISQTAANVARSASGTIINGTAKAGVTIAAGNMVYLDTATGTYGLADADASSPAFYPAGMALGGAGPGQPFFICTADAALNPGATGMTVGQSVFLSQTPGGITEGFTGLATGGTVKAVLVGQVQSATTISLNLSGLAPVKA